MRGGDERSGELFSYVDLEARVRRDHPLRGAGARVRGVVFADGAAFDPAGKAAAGNAAANLLFDPSERLLMERLEYDLLFLWFVGSASTTRRGTIRCSRRTPIGCWTATSRRSSCRRCWHSPR
jgi:hypothetical protein